MNYDLWLQTDVAFEERERRYQEDFAEVKRLFGDEKIFLFRNKLYSENEILEVLESHYGKDEDGFELADWEITPEDAVDYI